MDERGFITRPKLRAAYSRICDSRGGADRTNAMQAAEAFLRTISRMAAYNAISFDEMAERLGY